MFIRLAILILALFACGLAQAGDLACKADFDHDTVGELPGTVLPGDPAGDYLSIVDRQGSVLVVDEIGGLTDQPVHIKRFDGGTGGPRVGCWLDPAYQDAGRFRIRWRSTALTYQFYMSIGAAATGRSFGGVEYRGGGRITYNGVDVGRYELGVPQEFEVLIDFINDVSRLWIDGEEILLNQVDFQDWDVLEVVTFATGGTIGAEFAFDEFEIIALDHSVPTEEKSWGAVKMDFTRP